MTIIPEVNSLFQQPWWLEAVAPNTWDAVELLREGSIQARLPYVVKKKFGLTVLSMPALTQTLGPWIRPSDAKYANQLAQQKDLYSQLIEGLPRYDVFRQNFHYSVTNWLPFYWKGFQQTTRYTYVLEMPQDLDSVWAGFSQTLRNKIRKAEKQVAIRSDLSLESFLEINDLTFQRQGLKTPYNRELVRRIDAACAARGCRKMFFAVDGADRIHAVGYVVWDDQSAYALMTGANPELRHSGAQSLIMWAAIKHASSVTRRFDFEGSMIERIEGFFRGFGARQVPYLQVTDLSRRAQVLVHGSGLLKALARA